MLITYEHLDASELRGTTQVDYLAALDADLQILDGTQRVYVEPSFAVVELARSLRRWLARDGWVFSSIFEPASASSPVTWSETEHSVRSFVTRVLTDLQELGLDPAYIVGR